MTDFIGVGGGGMRFYILCKNEVANIRKCIESLLACGMDVTVLDSGSTDGTLDVVRLYPVSLVSYAYTNHCNAYNELTLREKNSYCGVLDADMEMTVPLANEIRSLSGDVEVMIAPVKMFTNGYPLSNGSLYPPKPIVFRGGREYFESIGHGERLVQGVRTAQATSALPHNDMKPYLSYLESQVRYSENFIQRAAQNNLNWRDRLRLHTPLFILLTPLYSLIVKGGLFSRQGWLYALDRLIAEAIMCRPGILIKLKSEASERMRKPAL